MHDIQICMYLYPRAPTLRIYLKSSITSKVFNQFKRCTWRKNKLISDRITFDMIHLKWEYRIPIHTFFLSMLGEASFEPLKLLRANFMIIVWFPCYILLCAKLYYFPQKGSNNKITDTHTIFYSKLHYTTTKH